MRGVPVDVEDDDLRRGIHSWFIDYYSSQRRALLDANTGCASCMRTCIHMHFTSVIRCTSHLAGRRQVQAQPARARGDDEEADGGVGVEAVDEPLPVPALHGAVEAEEVDACGGGVGGICFFKADGC